MSNQQCSGVLTMKEVVMPMVISKDKELRKNLNRNLRTNSKGEISYEARKHEQTMYFAKEV